MVSVGVHGLWFCRVDFKGLFEVWTCEPVGAVDDISVTVAVEVTDGGTFAEVGLTECLALEGVNRTGGNGGGRGGWHFSKARSEGRGEGQAK